MIKTTKYWQANVAPLKFARGVLAICLLFMLNLPTSFASSDPTIQPLASISQAATAFAEAHAESAGFAKVQATSRGLDKRLRLPLCPQPLDTFTSQPQRIIGKSTVGVRCSHDSNPWTLYVGVSVTAMQQIPVLAAALPRGAIISETDLKLIEQPINQAHQRIITDPDLIIGMQLKRLAREGATLSQAMLVPPKIVKRGQQITLVASTGALKVKMAGKAMGDGAVGDRIAVKNLSSGTMVEGVVNNDGTISVN